MCLSFNWLSFGYIFYEINCLVSEGGVKFILLNLVNIKYFSVGFYCICEYKLYLNVN